MYMYMCIFIYYKHIYINTYQGYIVIYIYKHTCITLSEDYTVCIYINKYIFRYCKHICMPLFKGFI